ncbi:MAG: flagellar basal body P-ring protein FlgI, partial [Lentisphaeraceae bacterium]|nr:flagellar basal body P-ring protein FlgI [Lentisphaeraceae bacterium]
MKKIISILLLTALFVSAQQKVKVRIKDVTKIKGSKDYFATGYGIVTGLKGTGDSDETLTQHTVNNFLKNLNIDVIEEDLKANNLAAVMITARIPGGTQKGEYVDCTVSTIGDASSLLGGILQLSPLLGTNGELIGVAQGALQVGGGSFGEAGAGGETVTKNVPTVASMVNAVELTRDVGTNDFLHRDEISFILGEPDYKSAQQLSAAINE